MNSHSDIRIGTLAGKGAQTPNYIRQILPHGFESFQINFWQTIPADVNLKRLATEVKNVFNAAGSDAVVSSLGVFGNPIENKQTAKDFARAIDAAPLFGCDLVCGFAGCFDRKPVPDALKGFKKTWAPLARRAADQGVRIAFENCDMGGRWEAAHFNVMHAPTAWEMMFHEVPAKNLGLEWEPCHQLVSLIDPLPQLKKWVGKIFHIHGKDATVDWTQLRTTGLRGGKPFVWHRTPGFGDTNWTDVISILRMHKWTGSIDIEGWHDPVYRGDLEMTGQVHALHYLQRCRGGDFVPNPN
jgi:sugar phosphate isomerase/epimerase